jgi:F-type H+-transporting ATPase subunit gamma
MMRLADIERHVSSMEELERIVGAMRAIASMRVQEAVRALASVREYGDALGRAVREALAIAADEGHSNGAARSRTVGSMGANGVAGRTPESSGRGRALVLFASEHGFVGGFNERVIEAAERDLTHSDALLIVGSRGAAFAAERGQAAAWTHPMATGIASVPETVRHLEEALYPRIARSEITCAEVIFGRYQRGGTAPIERRRLFPLELEVSDDVGRSLTPLHNLPAPELLERLTAEYILAQLTEAAIEALAAENGARFATMESASDNITHKLGALRLEASRARQEEVTTELLDLIIGGHPIG